uniref:transposase n=1 Tax=Hymenobacter terrenus TaxID=1629124 RepID=UPI0012E00D50|nr:transposase [Hymenobacter terrenus]
MPSALIPAARKRYSSDLSLRDWQRLAPLFVVERRSKWPLAEVVNAILYVLKNGCVWRDLPGDFPPWGTVYWYFTKWEVDGTWTRASTCLNVSARETAQKKPGPRP